MEVECGVMVLRLVVLKGSSAVADCALNAIEESLRDAFRYDKVIPTGKHCDGGHEILWQSHVAVGGRKVTQTDD